MIDEIVMELRGIGKRKHREYKLFDTNRGKCDLVGHFETKDVGREFALKMLSDKPEGRALLNSEHSNILSWRIIDGEVVETDMMVEFYRKLKSDAAYNKSAREHSARHANQDALKYEHHVYDSPTPAGIAKMRFTLDGSPLRGGAKQLIAQIQHECAWKGLSCYISEAGNVLHKSYAFVITGDDGGIEHMRRFVFSIR